MPRFSVVLKDLDTSKESPVIWWRVYSIDGTAFDCGHSSQDMLQRGVTAENFNATNTIFAWMRFEDADGFHRKWKFFPQEILPLPLTSWTSNVTFMFDSQGQCHSSHFVIKVINQTGKCLDLSCGKCTTSSVEVPPSDQIQEIVTESAFYLRPKSPIVIKILHDDENLTCGSENSPLLLEDVSNGDTITVYYDGELNCIRQPLKCPIPDHDIPIRCINRSGQDACITVFRDSPELLAAGDGPAIRGCQSNTAKANGPPFIIWLPWHPSHIQWSTESVPTFSEPYKSGMTVTIRSKAAIEACHILLEANNYNYNPAKSTTTMQHHRRAGDAKEFIDMLEDAGELERCAKLFADQLVEYWQLPLLSDHDWERVGVKVGSRIRIQHELRQRGLLRPSSRTTAVAPWVANNDHGTDTSSDNYEFDVFLSHRHEGGEDLAQAIKLQLQVMFPGDQLRRFLDVDDLRNLADLKNHVLRSRHFMLLLTPGVLERPYCQLELRTALEASKDIILVHDVKNCPFPDPSILPADLRGILDQKVVPYHREQTFREASIREIAKEMGLLLHPMS